MPWNQSYDPAGHWLLSTFLAALPIIVLLGTLAFLKLRAHLSALLGLGTACFVAVAVFGMPPVKAGAVAAYGAAYGLFPIGWIILNVIFLYALTEGKGRFAALQAALAGI
jgi:lactate permease